MRPEDAGEGVMVPSQAGDDALGIVPVDEYNTVFSFPTVGKDSEIYKLLLVFKYRFGRGHSSDSEGASSSSEKSSSTTSKGVSPLRSMWFSTAAIAARSGIFEPPKMFPALNTR